MDEHTAIEIEDQAAKTEASAPPPSVDEQMAPIEAHRDEAEAAFFEKLDALKAAVAERRHGTTTYDALRALRRATEEVSNKQAHADGVRQRLENPVKPTAGRRLRQTVPPQKVVYADAVGLIRSEAGIDRPFGAAELPSMPKTIIGLGIGEDVDEDERIRLALQRLGRVVDIPNYDGRKLQVVGADQDGRPLFAFRRVLLPWPRLAENASDDVQRWQLELEAATLEELGDAASVDEQTQARGRAWASFMDRRMQDRRGAPRWQIVKELHAAGLSSDWGW